MWRMDNVWVPPGHPDKSAYGNLQIWSMYHIDHNL